MNDSDFEDEWFGKCVYVLLGVKVVLGVEEVLVVEDVYCEGVMGYYVCDGGNNIVDVVWK